MSVSFSDQLIRPEFVTVSESNHSQGKFAIPFLSVYYTILIRTYIQQDMKGGKGKFELVKKRNII